MAPAITWLVHLALDLAALGAQGVPASRPASAPAAEHSPKLRLLLQRIRDGSKDGEDRAAAVYGILELGEEARAAVPALVDLLAEFPPDARIERPVLVGFGTGLQGNPLLIALTSVLARLGPAATPGVVALLEHPQRRVRVRAIQVLGRMGEPIGPAALELRRVLRSEDAATERAGLAACVELGRAARILTPDLVELLDADTQEAAGLALDALVAIGKDAVPSVEQALAHKVPAVRLRAVAVLRRIGPAAKGALPALRRLAQDPDVDVRAAAVSAIERVSESR